MEAPFLIKEDSPEPRKITAETVFSTVKEIIAAGREQEFLEACKTADAFVLVEPKYVNFTKTFMFSNRMHRMSEAAADVVRSARCEPG